MRESVRPRRRLVRAFAAALALLWVSILVVQLADFIAGQFERSIVLGTAFAVAAALVFVTGVSLILIEIVSLWKQSARLHDVEARAARVAELYAADGHGGGRGMAFAADLFAAYEGRREMAAAAERFRAAASTAHSDRQILALLVETAVRPLDRQAYALISRAARDSGVAAALSPFGLLDAGLVLWRSFRMVREVASVYGFRPGLLGRWALARRVLSAAAAAGAGDFVADVLLSQIGARVGGLLLSAWTGEGVLVAMRTARLGLLTMAACRPIPFLEHDRASMGRLAHGIAVDLGRREDGP